MRTYLLVDPDPTVTRQTRDLLRLRGADPDRVPEAHTAEETLRLFRDLAPEVTILGIDRQDPAVLAEVPSSLWEIDPGATIVVQTDLPTSDHRSLPTFGDGEDGAGFIMDRPPGERDIARLLDLLGTEDQGLTRIPP